MRIKGTVKQFEKAFGQQIVGELSDDFVLVTPNGIPKLPKSVARLVKEQIWIYPHQVVAGPEASTQARRLDNTLQQRAQAPYPVNEGALIGRCPAMQNDPQSSLMMTTAQAARAYRIRGLQPKATVRGDQKPQTPIAVLALGSAFSNQLLKEAVDCFGATGKPKRFRTDGMSGPLSWTSPGEGDLDMQIVTATIVDLKRIPVFETSLFPPNLVLGPAAVLNAKARPDVLTISYGTCEPELGTDPLVVKMPRLADALFMRLGLVGTSVLAASGDSGSSVCVDQGTGVGPRLRAVNYPASSQWVTAVGGTRLVLTENNRIASEVTWNDSEWGVETAGGGGKSILFGRPSWQPKSVTGIPNRRAVPDLSAHASTFPGFPIVGLGQPEVFAQPVGGTSAATPLVASGIALLNAKLAKKGKPPLGFLNPWIYQTRFKATRDITSGNNDLYGVGCCSAKKGFDLASGLGSPNFKNLLKRVPKPR
jgi:subtilisin family serine protease